MSDLTRLLPEGFLDAYQGVGGGPPEDFLEAYELLCDVLYFGTGIRDDNDRTTGGPVEQDYFFGEPRLLNLKTAVDQRLAAIRAELRKWAVSREGATSRRPGPAADRRGDLAGARGPRHPGAQQQDKEA